MRTRPASGSPHRRASLPSLGPLNDVTRRLQHPPQRGRSSAVQALLEVWAPSPLPPDDGHFEQALARLAARSDDALALEYTVPYCATRCLCCERDVSVAQPAEVMDNYVDDLACEMSVLAGHLGHGRDVLRLHLGGGTANELGAPQLSRLMEALARCWRLPAEAQLSADCDPRRTGWLQLRLLRGLGFRRLSFGVLDLDPQVQAAIGRTHSAALVADVCDAARDCGVESVELQLMVGLPHQNLDSWRRTLQQVLAMAPDRLRLAHYRHRPAWVPAQRGINAQDLPSPVQSQELAALTAQALCAAGYCWIGADQFVLESDELAQALEQGRLRCDLGGYSALPPLPQLGLGVGAAGEIDGSLFWNEPTLQAWRAAVRAGRPSVAHAVPAEPAVLQRRAAAERLLCTLQLPQALAGNGLADAYARLARQEAAGVVRVEPAHITVTERGRSMLHQLCAVFAAPAGPCPATPQDA